MTGQVCLPTPCFKKILVIDGLVSFFIYLFYILECSVEESSLEDWLCDKRSLAATYLTRSPASEQVANGYLHVKFKTLLYYPSRENSRCPLRSEIQTKDFESFRYRHFEQEFAVAQRRQNPFFRRSTVVLHASAIWHKGNGDRRIIKNKNKIIKKDVPETE